MIKKLLIYNSGGGIGDSVQLLPLINTLKNELKETKFYYLSSHDNHFNSTLKDFNCSIENLNLEIKYFGFRWWHVFATKSKVKRNNIDFFDVIIDLQTKFRNSIILKSIPHKYFVSSSLNFLLSNPRIKTIKYKRIAKTTIESLNVIFNKRYTIGEYNLKNIDKKFFDESVRLLPKKNYVGFSITQGNVYRKKEWPFEKVIKTAEEFVKINKIPVFFLEKKYNELKNKIENLIPSAVFPEHQTKLGSPALVTCLGKRLDFSVTIDNGIMHMLSLSKVPLISLFGPTDSEKFAPEYKSSIILDSKKIYNTKDISSISVEDVLMASKQLSNF